MKRKTVEGFPRGSAEYVIMHSAYRRGRGKNPSESYKGELNPKKALALAFFDSAIGIVKNDHTRHFVPRDRFAGYRNLQRGQRMIMLNDQGETHNKPNTNIISGLTDCAKIIAQFVARSIPIKK